MLSEYIFCHMNQFWDHCEGINKNMSFSQNLWEIVAFQGTPQIKKSARRAAS